MNDFLIHCGQHIELAGIALLVGCCVGAGIGLLAYEVPLLARPLIGLLATLRVIPSLAVLMFVLPFFGIGLRPAVIALSLLALAPIAIAVEQGLRSVPNEADESARAMGATPLQLRRRILWPLALPTAFGGVRIAAVEAVAGATLAAFVGGGGLGDYIVEGLATEDVAKLLEGGVSIALLAWFLELALGMVQRKMEYKR